MSMGYVPDFRFQMLCRIFTIKLGRDAENPTVTARRVIATGIFLSDSDNIFLEKIYPRAKLEASE